MFIVTLVRDEAPEPIVLAFDSRILAERFIDLALERESNLLVGLTEPNPITLDTDLESALAYIFHEGASK